MSGFWNYTYCIHSDDLTLIEQTLTRLLEQEACHHISLPELAVDVEELRPNPWLLCDDVCSRQGEVYRTQVFKDLYPYNCRSLRSPQ
jgi:hypothetical protein